jgi:FkbM family methyltransferase
MECRRRIANKLMAMLALVVAAQISAGCASQKQRCVFIDGGAHFGESYTAFQKTNLYSRYSWELFAIEANPKLIDRLPHAPRLTVLNKAIWVSDGTLEFHMASETSGVNSVVRKFEGEGTQTITVESFDFSQWVKRNFSEKDYVILSMDIEGAEFQVLDKMFQDGTIAYVDRLYVEFHPRALISEGMPKREAKDRVNALVTQIGRLKIIFGDDSAEDIMRRGDWVDFLL